MLLAGAGVAVAVGIAAGVAAAGVEAAGVVAAVGGGHDSGGCGIGEHDAMEQLQCGSGSVAAAAVLQRQRCGVGSPVASAWQCQHGGVVAVAVAAWHRQRGSGRGGPMWQKRCGSSGVAAAAGGSSGAGPAVLGDQSEGRACVRAGAQTPDLARTRAHLRGYQRGRSGRASGRNRTWFFKGTTLCSDNALSVPEMRKVL